MICFSSTIAGKYGRRRFTATSRARPMGPLRTGCAYVARDVSVFFVYTVPGLYKIPRTQNTIESQVIDNTTRESARFHACLWNNLLDFYKKSNKFQGPNRPCRQPRGRFLNLAVYFLSIRLIVRNFVPLNKRHIIWKDQRITEGMS